jgi:hypothetical protein
LHVGRKVVRGKGHDRVLRGAGELGRVEERGRASQIVGCPISNIASTGCSPSLSAYQVLARLRSWAGIMAVALRLANMAVSFSGRLRDTSSHTAFGFMPR